MKAVVVTGAERGLGKAIARTLLEDGYHLIALSLSMAELEKMKQEMVASLGIMEHSIDLIEYDLEDIHNMGSLVGSIHSCLDNTKSLWAYVNNAAVFLPRPGKACSLLEIGLNDTLTIMNVNMVASLFLSREMFRLLKENGNGGAIVFISSTVSIRGSVINPVYAMTKAALVNLVKSMSIEGGPEKIRINAISPGIMETQMGMEVFSTRNRLKERVEKNLIKRACTPEEVSQLVKYLISVKAEYITGQNLVIDGGLTV